MGKLLFNWHYSIKEINKVDWLDLTKKYSTPFYSWDWLNALEESESVCQKTGWQPIHLSISRDNKPIAIAPLYIKGHSFGEFIFDQSFAELANQLGINYYPKLIGMSPFSPIEGYRFFYTEGEDEVKLTRLLLENIEKFARKNNILSCNFLYVEKEWGEIVAQEGYAKWLNRQSIWEANKAKDFSDYLAGFNSNQRKNIKKERKAIKDQGIIVSAISGSELTQNHLMQMHSFYEQHCAKWGVWGSKYLSKKFFSNLSNMEQKKNIVLFNAYREEPNNSLAMSLCVKYKDMLWGRYYGSKEEIDFLHFEICYYAPISWGLKNGISKFDPGAGGSHKQRRGFLAKSNTSLHIWFDKRMELLINPWMQKANKVMFDEIKATNKDLPFKIETKSLKVNN